MPRTKQQRLASLNSRFSHIQDRIAHEKSILMHLSKVCQSAGDDARLAEAGRPPRGFDHLALGKSTKAVKDQHQRIAVLENEQRIIDKRIDELTEEN